MGILPIVAQPTRPPQRVVLCLLHYCVRPLRDRLYTCLLFNVGYYAFAVTTWYTHILFSRIIS